MILGMSTAAYTFLHVMISIIGIVSGLIVLASLITGRLPRIINALFLITTALTSLGGFAFPNSHITPGIVIGVLSLITLAITITALNVFHLAGGWRKTFVITAMIALYFNVFVLVVQLFLKVPFLHALAPKGSEPPFAISQVIVMVLFIVLTTLAVKRFRPQPILPA